MKASVILLVLLNLSQITCAQTTRPKLILGIVIDQMRQEYLWRYQDKWGEGGFRRLMNDGFVAENAHYNYIPTYTGPGHASIYTGTTPSAHGIIANNWYDRQLARTIYCAEDTTVSAVGGSPENGSISPRNLLTTTITDELKLSTNGRSRIVALSIKDRGAALPAGHLADGAYWYDSPTGLFMTSTFYQDKLPGWVQAFNNRSLPDKYLNEEWTPLLPLDQYTESGPDDSPYERVLKGKEAPTFPYDLKSMRKSHEGFDLLSYTPYGNAIMVELALAAIEGEQMGADDIPDFLAVSFSSPDYAGHVFGPQSIEVQDMYLRLDRDIERLLRYLDEKMGKGNYLIFLTSDHGAVDNPQSLEDQKLPGGYRNSTSNIEKHITSLYGADVIASTYNHQFFLDHAVIKQGRLDTREITESIMSMAMESEDIASVFRAEELHKINPNNPQEVALRNGYHRKRSGDILLLTSPGFLDGERGDKGTSHGTGYAYDTHIPVIFYGAGIPKGSSVRKISITDIAPTLSLLLDITLPASTSGEPITEIFE